MFEFIATADWHLEAMDKHFPDDGVDRQLETVNRIYQYAIENGIKYMMVPGDITDKYLMRDSTKQKLLQLFIKYDPYITTIYLCGNHDWRDTGSTSMDLIQQMCEWKFLQNLEVISRGEQRVIEGITVNFLPFPTPPVPKSKKPCLNFCHVETKGALGDTGRPLKTDKTIGCDARDFTISGHIHMYQFLESDRFLYCSSPYQKTYGEAIPKGFCHVRAQYKDGKLVVKHKFVDSKPGFRLETVYVMKQEEWTNLEINPAVRYRVMVGEGVTVPADIRTRVPNIAQLHKGKAAIEAAKIESIDVSETDILDVDPVRGLKAFLKAGGLRKSVREKAVQEVRNIISSISN